MKYVARNVFCVINSSATGVVGGGGGGLGTGEKRGGQGGGGGGGGVHSVTGSGKPIL